MSAVPATWDAAGDRKPWRMTVSEDGVTAWM